MLTFIIYFAHFFDIDRIVSTTKYITTMSEQEKNTAKKADKSASPNDKESKTTMIETDNTRELTIYFHFIMSCYTFTHLYIIILLYHRSRKS